MTPLLIKEANATVLGQKNFITNYSIKYAPPKVSNFWGCTSVAVPLSVL